MKLLLTKFKAMAKEKRYWAYLVDKNFPHGGRVYRNVTLELFKSELSPKERKEIPKFVKDYKRLDKNDRVYTDTLVEELFTAEEILEMSSYFGKFPDLKFNWREAEIPIEARGTMGRRAIPVGGHTGFYMFAKREDYPLSFPVWAYFDVDI